jgi:hypothetical protein
MNTAWSTQPFESDAGATLLTLLEQGVRAGSTSSLEGCVAIGVQSADGEAWLVAELGTSPTTHRSSELDRDADAILLLPERVAAQMMSTGSDSELARAQAGGDRELLIAFVDRCLRPRSILETRLSSGQPPSKRSRR